MKSILRIGIPARLENTMFQVGKLLTQSLVSTFSPASVTANAVAWTLIAVQYTPGNALVLATTPIVGQCIGAGKKDEAKKYTKLLVGITYAAIITTSVLLLLSKNFLLDLYNLSDETALITKQLILVHTLFCCPVWAPSFVFPCAFRAANDIRFALVISLAAMWVVRVAGSYVLSSWLSFGVMGVWLAMGLDWTLRAVIFTVRYLRKTWLTKYYDA